MGHVLSLGQLFRKLQAVRADCQWFLLIIRKGYRNHLMSHSLSYSLYFAPTFTNRSCTNIHALKHMHAN